MNSDKIVISLCDLTGHMVLPWAEAGYKCICIDTQHPEGMQCHPLHDNIMRWGIDILDDEVSLYVSVYSGDIVFMSCFPPCTDLTGAGARWWKDKGDEAYEFAMKLVRRCEWLGELSGAPYFIENPPGRIQSGAGCTVKPHPAKWRKWDYRFQPYEYGGYHGEGRVLWEKRDINDLLEGYRMIKGSTAKKAEIPFWHDFTAHCKYNYIELPSTDNDGYHKSTCLWTGGGFVMPKKKPIPFNDKPNFIHMCAPGEERANIRSVTPMGFAYAVYEKYKI
jgi:hypothetical protein